MSAESTAVMREPRITKVVVNIGVGQGGNRLQAAEKVLQMVTGLTPVRTLARTQNRDLGQRKDAPVGCKVTIRDREAVERFLRDALWTRENTLHSYCFDASGNVSFGVRDYTDFPEQKYDPDIGIFGFDIAVVMERPGHRVSRRRRRSRPVGQGHRLQAAEARAWFAEHFGITMQEE